jgi:hypothetical protein
MLGREIIAAYSTNHMKPINTLCGQNAGILMFNKMVEVRVPVGGKNFLFFTSTRPALGPTQPSTEVKKICGSIYPLPHTPSWYIA